MGNTSQKADGMLTSGSGLSAKMPFSMYDIFGYLAPGGICLLGCYWYELWFREKHIFLHTKPCTIFLHMASLSALSSSNSLIVAYFIILLVLSYILGHIIATLSSAFFDRILIAKGYGYPYKSILRLEPYHKTRNSSRACHYRGLFFWTNLFILLIYLWIIMPVLLSKIPNLFPHHTPSLIEKWITSTIYWSVLTTLIIILLDFVSYRLRNVFSLFSQVYWFFARYLFAGPFDFCAALISRSFLGKTRLQKGLCKRYSKYFKCVFDIDADKAGTNNYWLSCFYILQKSPPLYAMIQNWLHLYSFARNLAAAFFIVFLYCIALVAINALHGSFTSFVDILVAPYFFWFLSLVMLYRFYYLYVNYYTKNIFRSFVFLSSENNAGGDSYPFSENNALEESSEGQPKG